MMPERDDHLIRLASSISDGTPVDWSAEKSRGPESPADVRGLQEVERLAAAHARVSDEFTGIMGGDLRGCLLAHYRIEEALGAGGMGVVYRARDERLGRPVALKIIPAERALDETARQILLREARIACSVNHHNVATIYDVGESQGRIFVAMEFVSGRTLHDLTQGGPLPPSSVVEYGIQIAAALHAAHEAGIVHRDLKSRNIAITSSGVVKVLDFGIAVRSGPQPADWTRSLGPIYGPAGIAAGTPAYMAPEQVRGEPPDRRTDVWALGVVLQEALTGTRPFTGQYLADLERAILREDPAPLPPSTSTALANVIRGCLKKDPGQRYQGASEIRTALESIRDLTPTPTAPPSSSSSNESQSRRRKVIKVMLACALPALALLGLVFGMAKFGQTSRAGKARERTLVVLPSRNGSGAESQQFLADGLTDGLINTFMRLSPLRVLSRTSSYAIAAERAPLSTLARKHSLDLVLESSVVQLGDRVRVNVELIDAKSDRQIWAQSYDRPAREALSLDREIASAVAQSLRIPVSADEMADLRNAPPVDLPAYRAYVLGRNAHSAQEYDQARQYYKQAIRLDSTFAPAYAGLADSYIGLVYFRKMAPEEALPQAMGAASRALAIDSTLASAHLALAFIHGVRWDWASADAELERALEEEPGSSEVWYRRSFYFAVVGRIRDHVDAAERAARLDPFSKQLAIELGLAYMNAGRLQDARVQFGEIFKEGGKEARLARAYDARCLVLQGHAAEAVSQLRTRPGAAPTLFEQEELAYALGRAGSRSEALSLIHALEAGPSASPLPIAATQLALGTRDAAFATLSRAVARHDSRVILIGVDHRFDSIRSDPRYLTLLRNIGLPSTT